MLRLQTGAFEALSSGSRPSQFNDSQLMTDALVQGFHSEASDFRSLASMSVGSLAFSLARSMSLACLGTMLRATSLTRPLSWGFALFTEVSAFRASNQFLHPENAERWNDARGFGATLSDFIALKGLGHFFGGSGFAFSQFSQATGMVLGEYVGEALDLRDQSHHSILQRYAHAISTGIALGAGGLLTRLATGSSLQGLESRLHASVEVQSFHRVSHRSGMDRAAGFAPEQMASVAVSLQESKNKAPEIARSWGLRDYQERMLVAIEQAVVQGDHSWLGLASPMQTGKSFMSGPLIELLQHYMPKETRYIVLTSSSTITRQSISDLSARFGNDLGRFDSDIKDYDKPITVASMFAFSSHLTRFDPRVPTVIINDEAYFTQSPSQRRIYQHFKLGEMRTRDRGKRQWLRPCLQRSNQSLVIGLSGTGAGLEDYHVPMHGHYNILDAIDAGWIRHLRGRRVVLGKNEIEYEEGKDIESGEQMIWWKPTINNARKLAALYHQRLHEKGYRDKNLIYVPTIQHAELMQRALNGMYQSSKGKNYAQVYHSKASKAQNKAALDAWALGNPVISIGMLSRGFRGEGAGAVFHTYQTDSIELFSQRTGRGWAGDPRVKRPDFYVLEVAWSMRAEFATLARVLGIVENKQGEFSTRGLRKRLEAAKSAADLARAVSLSAAQADATVILDEDVFAHLPRLEAWRKRMAKMVENAKGVNHLAAATGLPIPVLNAYALGSIPTRLDHMIRLSRFWEDGISPERCFVDTWLSVADEWLAGGQGLAAPFVDALSTWVTNSTVSLALRANALDQILWNEFNHPVHTGRPLELSYKPFLRILQSYWAATRGEGVTMPFEEGELWRLCKNEASTYVSRMAIDSYKAIVQERLLTDSPTSVEKLARRLKMEPDAVSSIQELLHDELLYGFVRKYFSILPYSPDTPLSSFKLTGAAKDAFARLETLNDLLTCEPYDYRRFFENPHMEDPLLEHNMAIGMNAVLNPFSSGVQSQKLKDVFSEEIVGALQVRSMEYVGEVTTCPIAELREFLGDAMVRKIQARLGEYHLTIGRSATWYRPGSADLKLCLIKPLAPMTPMERLRRRLPVQPLPVSAELRNALFDLPIELLDDFFTDRVQSAWKKLGLEYIGDLVRLDAEGLAANDTKIASTSTQKIRECLHRMGLSLKMDTSAWTRPPGKVSKGLRSISIAYFLDIQQAFLRLAIEQSELPDALKAKLIFMGVARMADLMRLQKVQEVSTGTFHYQLEGAGISSNQIFTPEELELINLILATQQVLLPRPILIQDEAVSGGPSGTGLKPGASGAELRDDFDAESIATTREQLERRLFSLRVDEAIDDLRIRKMLEPGAYVYLGDVVCLSLGELAASLRMSEEQAKVLLPSLQNLGLRLSMDVKDWTRTEAEALQKYVPRVSIAAFNELQQDFLRKPLAELGIGELEVADFDSPSARGSALTKEFHVMHALRLSNNLLREHRILSDDMQRLLEKLTSLGLGFPRPFCILEIGEEIEGIKRSRLIKNRRGLLDKPFEDIEWGDMRLKSTFVRVQALGFRCFRELLAVPETAVHKKQVWGQKTLRLESIEQVRAFLREHDLHFEMSPAEMDAFEARVNAEDPKETPSPPSPLALRYFSLPIDRLGFSPRLVSALQRDKIRFLGQVACRTEESFKTSLNRGEIRDLKRVLAGMALGFEENLGDWRIPDAAAAGLVEVPLSVFSARQRHFLFTPMDRFLFDLTVRYRLAESGIANVKDFLACDDKTLELALGGSLEILDRLKKYCVAEGVAIPRPVVIRNDIMQELEPKRHAFNHIFTRLVLNLPPSALVPAVKSRTKNHLRDLYTVLDLGQLVALNRGQLRGPHRWADSAVSDLDNILAQLGLSLYGSALQFRDSDLARKRLKEGWSPFGASIRWIDSALAAETRVELLFPWRVLSEEQRIFLNTPLEETNLDEVSRAYFRKQGSNAPRTVKDLFRVSRDQLIPRNKLNPIEQYNIAFNVQSFLEARGLLLPPDHFTLVFEE